MHEYNVIVIVSDTFRRDHLGFVGNAQMYTPHLDRFAEKASVFNYGFPSSFPTVPARADLMTGRHTFSYLGWSPLPREETTIAQLMSNAGYHTFGVTDVPFLLRHGYGYDRGFADFHWVRGQLMGPTRDNVVANWRTEADRFAPTTMRIAAEWLEHHYDDKFFLYVDTWDPHEPWQPPKHYIDQYDKRFRDETAAYPTYWDWKEAGYTQHDIDVAHTLYCAEISMVDRAVGNLLERVKSLGIMEKTIIFFVSDHGFYFGEHGLWGKGRYKSEHGNYLGPVQDKHNPNITLKYRLDDSNEIVSNLRGEWYRGPLYEEITRVPFMVYVPGQPPQKLDAMVCLPDIVPTILDLVGIDIPDRVQAKSLVGLLEGKADTVRDFVVSSWPMYAPGQAIRVVDDEERNMRENQPSTIRDAEWSMLYSIAGEPVELYNMIEDPHQTKNVFSDNVDVAQRLHQQLLDYLTSLGTDDVFLTPRQTLQ